jgi:hypothetical protein
MEWESRGAMIDPDIPSALATARRCPRPTHGSPARRLAIIIVAAPLLAASAGENPPKAEPAQPTARGPAQPAAGAAAAAGVQVNLAFTVNNMGYTDTCG